MAEWLLVDHGAAADGGEPTLAAPGADAAGALGDGGEDGGGGGGGPFAGVTLPGSRDGADLTAEIDEAVAAFAASQLRADAVSGLGLAPLIQQGDAIRLALSAALGNNDHPDGGGSAAPPLGLALPSDWQEEPTKAEWKALAKMYKERRAAGESAEALAVLGEGLRASGCKAARMAVEGEEEEATAE